MARPDELIANGPPDRPRGRNNRTQERYECRQRKIVRLTVRPSFQSFPALVRDVSAAGIGFLLNRPLELGAVLALQLRGGQPGTSVTRIARVVHVRRHLPVRDAPWVKKKPLFQSLLTFLNTTPATPNPNDLIWLIGCRLSPPLTQEELESLR